MKLFSAFFLAKLAIFSCPGEQIATVDARSTTRPCVFPRATHHPRLTSRPRFVNGSVDGYCTRPCGVKNHHNTHPRPERGRF
jgi:hypothetical protein